MKSNSNINQVKNNQLKQDANQDSGLKRYGLSGKFEALAAMQPDLTAARVLSQEKGLYRIVSDYGEKAAEVSGKFRHNTVTLSDFPAVGDFVLTDWNDNGGNAIIHKVLPRKSVFTRKAAGKSREEQVVAANIDTIFLCMSLNNDFNLRRLERYLSIGWDSGAVPVIVLTKSDLCSDTEIKRYEIQSIAMGVDILFTTALEDDGYSMLLPYISEGKTVAIMGSSGVGKSTLINYLLGESRLDTKGLRNDDKGRHTTTHRELILLPEGGMVIDTPGMRELGMWDSEEGISQVFADIEELALKCRFRNCTHSGETGCAVQQALEAGELSRERFQSYLKLKAENAYAEDSESYLAAKERKFKEIAKYNKSKKKR